MAAASIAKCALRRGGALPGVVREALGKASKLQNGPQYVIWI